MNILCMLETWGYAVHVIFELWIMAVVSSLILAVVISICSYKR